MASYQGQNHTLQLCGYSVAQGSTIHACAVPVPVLCLQQHAYIIVFFVHHSFMIILQYDILRTAAHSCLYGFQRGLRVVVQLHLQHASHANLHVTQHSEVLQAV